MAGNLGLATVMADKDLKQVLEKLVEKRGIWKSYELATIHRDERTADRIYFTNTDVKDLAFGKGVYEKGIEVYNRHVQSLVKKLDTEIKAREGASRVFTDEEKEEIYVETRTSDEWKKFFKLSKVILNQRLDVFCQRELPHTPEYAEYVRRKAQKEAEKLAKEHEMDREIDEWLDLSVAVATGDDRTASRLSQNLSKKHQPKKGKAKKAADFLAAAKTRMKKLF